jgi:peptidyl-prolyl cis-trans isomerase B (cyclophilin B)
MPDEQLDRRRRMPGGRAVAGIATVATILLVSGCGGSAGNGGSSATTSKQAAPKKTDSEANGCVKVAQPKPREESLPKPKMTIKKGEEATVVVETNCGAFEITLATKEAPTIANSFAYLVEEGFYNDLTFHRIVPEFVIQGGDPTGTGEGGPGYEVVEAPPPTLKYTIGTVAMAKTQAAPAGASGSQFYIVSGPQGETLTPEYALVGRVTKGLDVVKRIGELGGPEEKPTEPVVIDKMTLKRG